MKLRAVERYRVMYRTPDHRQTTKRGFKTKREAELYLATVETNKARGEYIDASAARVTIASLGTEWLANQAHLKPSSLRPLEIAWRLQVDPLGRRPVGNVRPQDVQTWMTSLGSGTGKEVESPTIFDAASTFSPAFSTSRSETIASRQIARGDRFPRKVARAHIYLTHHQVAEASAGAAATTP